MTVLAFDPFVARQRLATYDHEAAAERARADECRDWAGEHDRKATDLAAAATCLRERMAAISAAVSA